MLRIKPFDPLHPPASTPESWGAGQVWGLPHRQKALDQDAATLDRVQQILYPPAHRQRAKGQGIPSQQVFTRSPRIVPLYRPATPQNWQAWGVTRKGA